MKKETKKAPTIRFRGFTDDWEQRKLGECCQEFKSGSFIPASDIGDVGKYPVYGGNGLRGFSSEYNHDGEFALIGRQGALCGNMNYSLGKAYFTEHAIAVQANKTADTKFLYYLLRKMNLGQYSDQSAQPGLAVGKLVKLTELFPSVTEQIKIGHQFMGIDNLITLHQRKLNQLKTLKKYFLQNMFPAKGEKVPRIRFKGFTGDWEQRKLGECAPIRGGFAFESKKFVNSGVPIIRISNILGDGNVGGEFTYYDEQNNDSQYILPDKALIMAMSGATTGKVGILNNPNNLKYYQNQRVGYFLPDDEYDYKFIGTFLRSNLFQNQLQEVLVSGAQPNISGNDINKFIINIPVSLAEQKQIGRIMNLFDKIVAIHQRKLDQLQTMKKFMLQNMFI